MNHTENNKLIAEFMEYPNLGTEGDFSYLKYHKEWNWLMPVVEKCYEYGELHNVHREGIIASLSGIIDINETYKAVVEFIKWYNNESKI